MADIIITPGSSIMSFTSSANYTQTITQDASGSLILQGSGSTGRTDLFTVNGNNGTLFSVSDDLSDSLFSVNTIAGLPVIEAFANNTVTLGQYGQNVLVVTGSRVGIGTSSPGATLNVGGTGTLHYTETGLGSMILKGASGTARGLLEIHNGDSASKLILQSYTGGSEVGTLTNTPLGIFTNSSFRLYITAAGNVGIGTTDPGSKLQVDGSITANGGNIYSYAGSGEPNISVSLAGNQFYMFNNSTYYGLYSTDYGSILLRNKSTGLLHIYDKLYIDSSGNVAIGTTSPLLTDTGRGNLTINGSTSSILTLGVNGTWNSYLFSNSTATYLHGTTQIIFETNSAERIRITSSGTVGIGTTNPSTKLQVNGDGGGSNSIFKIVGSASDSFNWASSAVYPNLTSGENVIHLFGRAESPNNSAYVGFKYASDGSSSNMLTLGLYASDNLVNILGNGNVGIGTTDPSVGGTVGSKFTIIQSDNSTAIAIYNGTSRRFALNPIANGGFTIFDGGGGGFNSGITQVNGLVGIGTTSPGERLTVNGSIALQTSGTQKYHIGYWISGLNFAETNVADARLFIKDGGNVGIGTSNPTYGLVVNNQSTSLSGTGTMYIAADLNGSGKGLVINSSTRTDSDAAVLALEITNRTGGNTLAATVGGKVGIGTTSPSTMLHIDSTSNQFRISGNSNNFNIYSWGGGVNIWGSENIYFGRDASTNNNFYFQTGNAASTAMYIETGNSRVGINTTAPQKILDAVVSANDFATVGAATAMAVGQWAGIHFGYRENNTNYRKSAIVFERTDLTSSNAQGKVHILNGPQAGGGSATLSDAKLTIAENGDVGIGSTGPSNKLFISAGAGTAAFNKGITILTGDSSFTAGHGGMLQFQNEDVITAGIRGVRESGWGSGLAFYVHNTSSGNTFASTFVERMRINESGNVGIGSTNPQVKLDVVGTGRFPIVIVGTDTVNTGNTKIQIASTTASNKLGFSGGANSITEENLYVWDFTTGASAGISFQYNGVVNATTFVGALSGNATTATNLSTNRTNWSTNGTISAVVGQLAWKNYGNSHTIIDASAGTAPNGASISNTNPDVAWTGTYPTLMGWNGSSTYGVRVDRSRYADSADTVEGISSARIVYGDGARASTSTSNMNDPNQKSGFHFAYNPTGRPYEEWWNWITIAGNSWQSSNNYQFQLAHDFHNDSFQVRRMTNGTAASWREVITSGNIGAQSVNYASSAGNADTLDTYHETAFVRLTSNSSTPTNGTFAIGTDGSRNFIQSHSGRPLDINPLGNTVTINSNVGIGITNPSTKLHVQGTSDTRITLSDTGGASIQLYQQASDSYILSTNATRIYTGGGERITITSGGTVGIGTTDPGGYNLSVNGSTRVVGSIIGQDSSNNTRYEFAPNLAYTQVGVASGLSTYKINSGAASLTSMLRMKSSSTYGWLEGIQRYFNGTVISDGLCAEVISTAGTLVFLTSDAEWGIADADVVAKSTSLLGIALNATSNIGDTVHVMIDGIISLYSNHDQLATPITPGAPIYVSTTGGNVTETAPSGTGDVVRLVGHNIWGTTSGQDVAIIRFQPDATWIEL